MNMKQIIVFGATGPTGRALVKQAIEQGLELTLIVRNLSSYPTSHPNLHVVKGDALERASFEKEMTGKDAVISCLGSGGKTKPTQIYSRGIENIISAMEASRVRRLTCISAMGLSINDKMSLVGKLLTKFVAQTVYKEPYKDMRLMEKILEKTNLDWTIIKPPMLTNKAKSGMYRVGINDHISRPLSISRADLAHYMLKSISDAKTFKAKVEIAY
jgi:putative NADH-flavin reductase